MPFITHSELLTIRNIVEDTGFAAFGYGKDLIRVLDGVIGRDEEAETEYSNPPLSIEELLAWFNFMPSTLSDENMRLVQMHRYEKNMMTTHERRSFEMSGLNTHG